MIENINIKISIIAVIFSVSFWFIYLSTDGSFMMQTLFPLILLLGAIYILGKKITFKIEKNDMLLFILFLIFVIVTTLNCCIHIEYISYDVITGLIYFGAIFLWFFLISKHSFNKKEIKFIINSLICFSIVTSLQVIYMYYIGENGKISVISVFGKKIDANYFSALASIISNFILLKILFSKSKNKIMLIISSIAFILTIFSITLSGSRAALISLIFSNLIILIQFFFKKFNLKKVVIICIGTIVLIIILKFISSVLPTWLFNRYFVNSYSDKSNNERIELWKNAFDGILEQPIGYGFGIFDKLPEHNQISTGRYVPATVPAHNTYLDILIYGGILGGIVFAIFLLNVFKGFFIGKNRILIPVILNLLFTSIVLGADKAVYFWNTIILLNIIYKYIQKNGMNFFYEEE